MDSKGSFIDRSEHGSVLQSHIVAVPRSPSLPQGVQRHALRSTDLWRPFLSGRKEGTFGLMDRRAGSLTAPVPTGLSLHPLPPTDGEQEAAERDVPRLPSQTPRAGQDGADSLCLLDVLDALGQAHVERLREQEGH